MNDLKQQIHLILSAVLPNGYMKGQTQPKLDTSVLELADGEMLNFFTGAIQKLQKSMPTKREEHDTDCNQMHERHASCDCGKYGYNQAIDQVQDIFTNYLKGE